MEALLFVNMGDDALNARSVEALQFVNMGDNALTARNVEALLFVSMGDDALASRNVTAKSVPGRRRIRGFRPRLLPGRSQGFWPLEV